MIDQRQKAQTLTELHQSDEAWVIPNPWDAGSARDIESLGFKAIATSSAACAYTLGKKDGEITVEDKIIHCELISTATNIPLSVDFEDGFSNEPKDVAKNILRLAESGAAGCSIEDYSRVDQNIFDFNMAVERIQAAVEAVASLDIPFQLVARADGLIRKHADLEDAIKRLQAFCDAGAHMIYAPGLTSLEQVKLVADNTSKPLNVLSPFFPGVSVQALGDAGATRLSMGNALLEKTRASFTSGLKEMLEANRAI